MSDSKNQNTRPHIVCNQCAHFYITFDPQMPYGCRAMDFKNHRLPEYEVWETTGHACLSFTPKEPRS